MLCESTVKLFCSDSFWLSILVVESSSTSREVLNSRVGESGSC